MPGYILHLTAARMYLDQLPPDDPLRCDPKQQNDFYAGNLIPDSVRDKSQSHFRDPAYIDRMIEWPHPDRFLEKYRDLTGNAGCRGYWFHLYIDRRFFRDYIPTAAEFLDENGADTDRRDKAAYVFLKKSGEKVEVSQYLSEEYYYRRLILSPMVTKENVNQVLDTDADLYYFNLHGGEGAESRGYFGATTPQYGGNMYSVILPEHMMTLKKRNAVISEACYGGKFIGLDKRRSMLLASLFTNTLSFVGSSRVAWGSVDSSSNPEESSLFAADIIAHIFIQAAIEGYDAGQSLFMARSMLLQKSGWGDPYAALTITEFNLYGDPALLLFGHKPGGEKPAFKIAGKASLAPKGSRKDKCTVERLDINGTGASVLQQVRGAVNANIMDMHSMISQYLYSNYSVEPRKLDSAFRLKYDSGKEEILFNYKFPGNIGGIETQYTVSATADGKIQKVYTTK